MKVEVELAEEMSLPAPVCAPPPEDDDWSPPPVEEEEGGAGGGKRRPFEAGWKEWGWKAPGGPTELEAGGGAVGPSGRGIYEEGRKNSFTSYCIIPASQSTAHISLRRAYVGENLLSLPRGERFPISAWKFQHPPPSIPPPASASSPTFSLQWSCSDPPINDSLPGKQFSSISPLLSSSPKVKGSLTPSIFRETFKR